MNDQEKQELIKAAAIEILGWSLKNQVWVNHQKVVMMTKDGWNPTLKENSAQTDMLDDKLVEMGFMIETSKYKRENEKWFYVTVTLDTPSVHVYQQCFGEDFDINLTRTQAYSEAIRKLKEKQ